VFELYFFVTARGAMPAREFVDELPQNHQAKFAVAFGRLREQGTRLGRPDVAHLRGRVWELRVRFGGVEYRIFFAPLRGRAGALVLLHGFVKKSQAVPERELRTAENRLAEFESRLDRGEVTI
jgi:phage-related protein